MAERVGFEPTIRFPVYTLSKRAPSATRPSLPRRICPMNHLGTSESNLAPLDCPESSPCDFMAREQEPATVNILSEMISQTPLNLN